MKRRPLLVLAVASAAALLAAFPAGAAAAPRWAMQAQSNTTAAPGSSLVYRVQLENLGDAETSGPIAFKASLPSGLKATALAPEVRTGVSTGFNWFCGPVPASNLTCSNNEHFQGPGGLGAGFSPDFVVLRMTVAVSPSAPEGSTKVAAFEVSGGGAAAETTVAAIEVTSAAPEFGVAGFDFQPRSDAAGGVARQAGGHPYDVLADIGLQAKDETVAEAPEIWPVEPLRDVFVDLPPGFVGNPAGIPRCSRVALSHSLGYSAQPLCPPSSQVGTVDLRVNGHWGGLGDDTLRGFPLFSVDPSPGSPASFGFQAFGVSVILDAHLRSDSDYGLTVSSRYAPEALPIVGIATRFWGAPADGAHEPERACSDHSAPPEGPVCGSDLPDPAFLRSPTGCQAPPGSPSADGLTTAIQVDSWAHPGSYRAAGVPELADPAWKSGGSVSHEGQGYPYPPSAWGPRFLPDGCANVPFSPRTDAQPTTGAADSPSGLSFDLTMPQQGLTEPGAVSESDLRDVRVVLPEGMTVNPSSAGGLAACSSAQIAIHSLLPPSCPDAAKIGTVTIETPLLGRFDAEGNPVADAEGSLVPDPLEGSVYLAAQGDNPFGSLLAMYVVVDDEQRGIVLKLPGEIVGDPSTGRLETVFEDQPQMPFSKLHLELFGGPRAALRTPAACGTYTTQATLTPWSGNAPVTSRSSFQITSGPNGSSCPSGFDPHLSAGTTNPLAGATSPFALRLWRDDGSAELGGLSVTLPPGLTGYLRGIPYCPDTALASVSGAPGSGRGQEASPSCPAASQVGTVTVGAGAGPTPFFTQSGRAYLAGPYKGAPLSLAVVTPAVAGPFDLGSVVVRNALQVDPATAQITAVSDPLPTILHGIPLDLRDIRVQLSRDHFTLNPTSCAEMSIASTISAPGGATAHPDDRFQVGGCERLAFKPRLDLELYGKTNRGAHPTLRALLRFPTRCGKKGHRLCPPGANIARARVALPHSEFLDQGHIRTICTRVQFAAGAGQGSACPDGSVYGYAKAYSPLLDKPLEGPVYLRSSSHNLPDLVAALDGQIHVDLAGRIDSTKGGGIRTTFQTVPDAPVTRFVLTMKGGRRGLLQNSTDVCAGAHRATAAFAAHNGKTHTFSPALVNPACAKGGGRQGHHGHL